MIKQHLAAFIVLFGTATASSAQSTFYLGAGTNNESEVTETDDTPFSFGFVGSPQGSSAVFGIDMAWEGEMLDSTFGSDSIRQALSINGVVGAKLYDSQNVTLSAAAIIGFRESFADCPDSFLGFQCYADSEPDTEYDLNLGALVLTTFDSVSVGVRVTQVSTQAVLGFSF